MGMAVGGEEGAVKSEINVTPLVDVMLVLLIIMMIVAPMLQKGVPVKLPTAENSSDKPETQDQTVLGVTADRAVYVDSVQVPLSELRRKIETTLEEKSVKLLYIKADEDAPYGAVMDAMDEARAAGVEDMGLITEKKTSGGGE